MLSSNECEQGEHESTKQEENNSHDRRVHSGASEEISTTQHAATPGSPSSSSLDENLTACPDEVWNARPNDAQKHHGSQTGEPSQDGEAIKAVDTAGSGHEKVTHTGGDVSPKCIQSHASLRLRASESVIDGTTETLLQQRGVDGAAMQPRAQRRAHSPVCVQSCAAGQEFAWFAPSSVREEGNDKSGTEMRKQQVNGVHSEIAESAGSLALQPGARHTGSKVQQDKGTLGMECKEQNGARTSPSTAGDASREPLCSLEQSREAHVQRQCHGTASSGSAGEHVHTHAEGDALSGEHRQSASSTHQGHLQARGDIHADDDASTTDAKVRVRAHSFIQFRDVGSPDSRMLTLSNLLDQLDSDVDTDSDTDARVQYSVGESGSVAVQRFRNKLQTAKYMHDTRQSAVHEAARAQPAGCGQKISSKTKKHKCGPLDAYNTTAGSPGMPALEPNAHRVYCDDARTYGHGQVEAPPARGTATAQNLGGSHHVSRPHSAHAEALARGTMHHASTKKPVRHASEHVTKASTARPQSAHASIAMHAFTEEARNTTSATEPAQAHRTHTGAHEPGSTETLSRHASPVVHHMATVTHDDRAHARASTEEAARVHKGAHRRRPASSCAARDTRVAMTHSDAFSHLPRPQTSTEKSRKHGGTGQHVAKQSMDEAHNSAPHEASDSDADAAHVPSSRIRPMLRQRQPPIPAKLLHRGKQSSWAGGQKKKCVDFDAFLLRQKAALAAKTTLIAMGEDLKNKLVCALLLAAYAQPVSICPSFCLSECLSVCLSVCAHRLLLHFKAKVRYPR